MKIISIIIAIVILIGITACSTPAPTTIINNTTVLTTSTIITTSTTTANSGLVAANSEVANVMTANQAYAVEHGGKFASNSNELLNQYLAFLPDAIYFFNENTGSITSAVNGTGITKNLQWDSVGMKWK